MLSTDRTFHFIAELTLNRSRNSALDSQPQDDETNWLFLIIENQRFSFVYKIEKPKVATYGNPFIISMAFTVIELVRKMIQINQVYTVMRGEEMIGTVKIVQEQPNNTLTP